MKIRTIAKIAFKFIICFQFWSIPIAVLSSTDDDTIGYIYEDGLAKYTASDYHAAIDNFTKVHSLDNNYKNNNSMLYKALVRQGDIEYRQNNFPDARRLYAQALGIAGEVDSILWRLKTIDDINERIRVEKENGKKETKKITLISFFAGIFIIILFSIITAYLVSRRKNDHPFADLLSSMPHLDESGTINRAYYDDIIRANHLKEILCAIITDSLTSDLLNKYISDLNDEIKIKVTDYIQKKEIKSDRLRDIPAQLTFPASKERDIIKDESYFTDQITRSINDVDNAGSFLLLANIIDSKTGRDRHSLNVAEHAYRIACLLGENEINASLVKNAALIHDLGFLGLKGRTAVDESMQLTDPNASYIDMIKMHTSRGSRIVHIYGMSDEFDSCVQHHHEHYDGSGYPNGLKGGKIPLVALIVSAAEYLEGLTMGSVVSPTISRKKAETLFGDRVGSALSDLIIQTKEG